MGNEWKKLHSDKVREYNQKAYKKREKGRKLSLVPSILAEDYKRYRKRLLFRCKKSNVSNPYAVTRKYTLHPDDLDDYAIKQAYINQIEKIHGTDKAQKVANIINKP